MSATVTRARRLLERTAEHPVVSLFFDLDPEQFATAPARATQARSLLDAAHNLAEADVSLGHDGRQMVRADLERLEAHLGSDELPVSGASGLAVFACGAVDLFETIELAGPVASEVYLERAPHLEPLVAEPATERWCAVLVSGRDAEIYLGHGRTLDAHEQSSHYVRGHGQVGGAARHSEDQDIEGHIIQVANALHEDWRASRFRTLLLGGPVDAVTRLTARLHSELRAALATERLGVDPSAVTDAGLLDAVGARVAEADAQRRERLVAEFAGQLIAAGNRNGAPPALAGVEDVLRALAEQRIETLLIARDFHAAGARCPRCGMIIGAEAAECPADGTATSPVADLREPVIAAALLQDAEVIALPDPVEELPPARPIGARLRF